MTASFPGYFLQKGRGFDVVDNTYTTWTLDPATNQLTLVPWITNTVVATDTIDNTQLADMADSTVKGRAVGAGTGDPQDLTAAQLAAIVSTSVDHGALLGLSDDDHPQYPLAAGTETIGGAWTFSTTPVVPDDSWTYAKIQNVSATSRVLGRITAGAGDIEELTGANIATIANASFDHGTLAGLSDDDHPQYPLATGTETISGTWTFNNNPTFTGTVGLTISSTQPRMQFIDTNAGADLTTWELLASGSLWGIRTMTDAGVAGENAYLIGKSATTTVGTHTWRTANTDRLVLNTASLSCTLAILSSSATAGVGYTTGAGGTVTQTTSRTTGVTINKVCGAITLFSDAGSTTPASFTVTNSAVAATDVPVVCQKSGTDKYDIDVTAVAAGSFEITFNTKSGTTVEQPVFSFVVIKGVAA